MQYLNRGAIDATAHQEYMDLEVPEWGGTVRLRRFDVRDRVMLGRAVDAKDPVLRLKALVVACAMVDGEGKPIYDPEKDLDELMKLDADPIGRVYDAAMTLSKSRTEDIETAIKNSEASPSSPSSVS